MAQGLIIIIVLLIFFKRIVICFKHVPDTDHHPVDVSQYHGKAELTKVMVICILQTAFKPDVSEMSVPTTRYTCRDCGKPF